MATPPDLAAQVAALAAQMARIERKLDAVLAAQPSPPLSRKRRHEAPAPEAAPQQPPPAAAATTAAAATVAAAAAAATTAASPQHSRKRTELIVVCYRKKNADVFPQFEEYLQSVLNQVSNNHNHHHRHRQGTTRWTVQHSPVAPEPAAVVAAAAPVPPPTAAAAAAVTTAAAAAVTATAKATAAAFVYLFFSLHVRCDEGHLRASVGAALAAACARSPSPLPPDRVFVVALSVGAASPPLMVATVANFYQLLVDPPTRLTEQSAHTLHALARAIVSSCCPEQT
eukprot:TRINITY_DN29137_c0_g1_i1.p2 TRINITY_DN29137_c0_g1~~TRINITY_DN29137_c0_g1_i1.p2  ORF type:complete len:284 (-),score=94.80 TRINITY_DN29137_c0_g1_i1:87-938(-)